MPTITEVADHAGVSRSTVSRVINGYEHVTPEVRERVLKSISVLNYRPSKIARSLRKQQSQSIGVVVRQQKTPFSSELAYSIENVFFQEGYHSLLCSTDGDPRKETEYIDMLIDHQVSGVILRPSRQLDHPSQNIERLLENNIAVVIVDVKVPNTQGVSQILCQNVQGGYDGMSYLLSLGHRHIAIIAPEVDSDSNLEYPGNLRLRGIQRAVDEHIDAVEPCYIFTNHPSRFENGYFGAMQVFEQYPETTAIFAITDMIAIGVIHAAHKNNIHIPTDLSVLGYDDIPLSSYVIPQLSTIAQPIKAMGELAAQTLMQHLRNKNTPARSIMLENTLTIRDSTQRLPLS
jgi:LacI family transcriptional regulator, galactose operon repressor